MTEPDPFCQITNDLDRQIIQTARPIVLQQGGGDLDGVVNVAADKDVVVYADSVTIKGTIQIRKPAPPASTDDAHPVAPGGNVLIVARRLDTVPGSDGDAKLDVTGGVGYTSGNIWSGPPHNGVGDTGDAGDGGGLFRDPVPGGRGQSSDHLTGSFLDRTLKLVVDPDSPLNGQKGDDGGDGAAGGVVDLRCGSLADTVALTIDASGGEGGGGLAGQAGAKGGKGGDGASSTGRWVSAGGDGGRGGDGGDGGDGGNGGAPGMVSIRLRNGSTNPITTIQESGGHGQSGAGGFAGPGGDPGKGWILETYRDPPEDVVVPADGKPGAPGSNGKTPPNPPLLDYSVIAARQSPCEAGSLVDGLLTPLTPQLAMILDLMRSDYLAATGQTSADALGDLSDRLDWVNTLASAYRPIDASEVDSLDAVRARIQTTHEHLSRGLDYFGNGPSFAPLGAVAFYKSAFDNSITALADIRTSYTTNLKVLESADLTEQQLQHAVDGLTVGAQAYAQGEDTERTAIADLIARITGHDSDTLSTRQQLVTTATDAFKEAVKTAWGLKLDDLIDCVGQFAFLGEMGPQQAAMCVSQTAKLIDTGVTKCLADDGTQVDKQWVINQLSTVDDLSGALTGYTGTINGIRLSDPGAVKLLGKQADLDQLCEKFWSYPGARDLKDAFEDYVSAVQARNADILTLNGSLARLHGYMAGAAQCTASIATARDKQGKLSAPGAPAIVLQLARMVSRATDDCVQQLYLMSRAFWAWSLQPDDELAKSLRAVGGTDALALTTDTLVSAAEQMASDATAEINERMSNAGAWFPKVPPGICLTLTHDTHPTFIQTLRDKRQATIAISAPRKSTSAAESPFSGLADVRINKVRPWVYGAEITATDAAKSTIRVDITHTGRSTVVLPDDSVHVIVQDPVAVSFDYQPEKTGDPTAIQIDGQLFTQDLDAPGALISPFTRWRVTIPTDYNDKSLDTSKIDKVVLEFYGHERPFPPIPEKSGSQ